MGDPRTGTLLDGRYRIIERLAAGGMGTVYRAERVNLGREVAVKFLHAWAAADPSFLKRFEVEARAMARLQHPNCAAVIDVGVEGHEPFVVMDMIGGEPLRALLERGAVATERALEIVRQILAGLAHAHGHGIVHRDIKPENVMVEAVAGFGEQVRILDFGLAKMTQGPSGLTAGFVLGTPSYMAPEQTLGSAVDARTDVYAVGVVLFELLTGRKPFVADEPGELLRLHRDAPAPRLADRSPRSWSAALEAVIARALAKAPRDRFATAAEMAQALATVPEARRAGTAPPAAASSPGLGHASTTVLASDALLPLDATVAQVTAGDGPHVDPSAPTRALGPAVASGDGDAGARAASVAPRSRWRWVAVGGGLAALVVVAVIALAANGGRSASTAVVGDAVDAGPSPPLTAGSAPAMADAGAPGDDTGVAAVAAAARAPAALPELERLRPKLRGKRTSTSVTRELQRLALAHPTVAEIPLLLGRIYFDKLWVQDGLEAFRKALRIDPTLRSDPDLIRAALNGLGNDRYHGLVRRFLAREIGAAARAQLEAVTTGPWREDVQQRAAATLRDLADG